MSQYAAIAQRSLAAIEKAGAIITFPGTGTGGIYDPSTDTWSGAGSADATGRAVQINGDPAKLEALELLVVNSISLMIAASGLTVTPAPGMAIVWAGVRYTLKFTEALAPDGTPIIWTVIGANT